MTPDAELPDAELMEEIEGIYRKNLQEEFGDAVRFGPVTVENYEGEEGQLDLAVVIVYEQPERELDTDKAIAAMAKAEAALQELGLSPAPKCTFAPEQEYPNYLRERSGN